MPDSKIRKNLIGDSLNIDFLTLVIMEALDLPECGDSGYFGQEVFPNS